MARLNQEKCNGSGAGIRAVTPRIAILLALLLFGAWLLLSPNVEFKMAQAEQDALMVSIMLAAETKADCETDMEADNTASFADLDEPQNETPVSGMEENDEVPATPSGSGILMIDRIDLKMPVTPGVTEEQLKIAAGWVTQTAPIGNIGNAVIAGHRQYQYGRQFNRLGELEPGDIIQYQSIEGEVMTFVVFEILIIEPGDQVAFDQPTDKAVITLYTCTPIRIATHRLLVRAERINYN
jgi:sortase A